MSDAGPRLEEMTWPQVERAIRDGRDTALVPCGTCEEHGPHLPCGTDLFIAVECCLAAAGRVPALVAPPLGLGVCVSTDGFPGTVGTSAETLRGLVTDVVRSLGAQGFRRVVLVTGHAGSLHLAALREACLRLAREGAAQVAIISLYDLITEHCHDLVETPGDGHAGEVETSLVLHLRPQLVKGTAAAHFPALPRFEVRASVRKEMASGVMGDPGKASAAKGKRIFEATVFALVTALVEMGK